MSVVGTFPGLVDPHRRVVRAEVNPLDKATVVSIYSHRIDETKPTISPGRFIIEPGTYEKPSLLTVGPSSWWKETDEDSPLLEIPNSAIQIANSIIIDYCNGLLACNMSDTMPGLFFVPGEIKVEQLRIAPLKTKLDTAQANQKRWFSALVRMGDVLWSRTNANPLSISDDMRMAARELGLEKEWMQDYHHVEVIRCVACGAMRNPDYPICGSCHTVIDVAKAEKLGLKYVQR